MSKSQRLHYRELRDLYLLIGECRELGADPVAWQTHLLGGLMKSIGAGIGAVIEVDPAVRQPAASGEIRPTSIVDLGWSNRADARRFQQFVGAATSSRNPLVPAALSRPGSVRTFRRRDLLTDEEYFGDAFLASYMEQTKLDDFVGQFSLPASGHILSLGLNRFRGDRHFERRDCRLLQLCGIELVHLHGTRLEPGASPSLSRLAPRLRQVLCCLFEGDSEKQVAVRVGISPHTVHEYVRRLYQSFQVSSRGALLAHCAPLLPLLQATGRGAPGSARP